MLTLRGL